MAAEKLQNAVNSTGLSASTARFERGELTVDQYLEALVTDAVALVGSKLSLERVEWLRGMLRDALVSDPVVRERVRQATGRELQTK